MQHVRRQFIVQRRNGYSAVDEYHDGQCIRTIVAGITNRTANIIAGACADAYERGIVDGQCEERMSKDD